ncbi:MAG: fibronectin type III domain-containing protein, partial [Patescibacteria group bacterium]
KAVRLGLTAKIITLKKAVNINMKTIKSIFLIFVFLFVTDSVLAAKCNDTRPDSPPDLFQIDVSKTSAKLFFTPVNNAISGYTIIYGTERGRDDFGVSFPHGQYEGVIDFTINSLNPNTKYYFRVRADNGCRQGWMSDTMSATTDLDFKAYTKFKGDSEEQTNNSFEVPEKIEDPLAITQSIDATGTDLINDPLETPVSKNNNQKTERKNIIVEFFSSIFTKIKAFLLSLTL